MTKILIYTSLFPTNRKPGLGIFVYRKWLEFKKHFPRISVLVIPIHDRNICSSTSQLNEFFGIKNCIHFPKIKRNNLVELAISYLISYVHTIIKSIISLGKADFDYLVIEWANPIELCLALSIAKIKKRKVLVAPKGSDVRILPFTSRFYLILMKFLLRNVDHIQVNSRNMWFILRKHYKINSNLLTLNYEGFSQTLHSIKEPCTNFEHLITKYQKSKHFIFGMIGKFDHAKMQHKIVQAIASINRDDITLFLIGEGSSERKDKINQLIQDLGVSGNIIVTGGVSNACLKIFLTKIPFFFHVSRSESLPVAIIEELSFGCVVIGSPVGGIPELVCDGSGILLKDNSIDTITEVIMKIIQDKYNISEISKNAKDKAWRYYTLEKQVKTLAKTLGSSYHKNHKN